MDLALADWVRGKHTQFLTRRHVGYMYESRCICTEYNELSRPCLEPQVGDGFWASDAASWKSRSIELLKIGW